MLLHQTYVFYLNVLRLLRSNLRTNFIRDNSIKRNEGKMEGTLPFFDTFDRFAFRPHCRQKNWKMAKGLESICMTS